MENSPKNKVNSAIIILAVSFVLIGIVHFVNNLDLSLDISLEIPKSDDKVTLNGIYFDTPVSITLYPDTEHSRSDCSRTINEVFKLCEDYEGICSSKDENSELYKINEVSKLNVTTIMEQELVSPADNYLTLKISKPLYEMISRSLYAHENYCSDFDITIEPLLRLWNFSDKYGKTEFEESPVPSADSIAEALKTVDSSKITLSEDDSGYYIKFPAGTTIDLGACAKGYIGDRIVEYLQKEGYKCAIVSLGGNVTCLGNGVDNEGFKVAIRDPFDRDKTLTVIKRVSDSNVITSGVYERCFEYEGNAYHHILSASTGVCADTDLVSATVIADSGIDADILSTCMILLGSDKALELAKSIPDTEVLLITKGGIILKSYE